MFSVVIPVFNSEDTIRAAIDSVLKQTRVDLIDEIVIVNDGSNDCSEKIIRNIISQNPDMEFNYINQKNKGVSAARNAGILKAKGEWIALLDADDLWKNNKLKRQYDVLKKHSNIKFLGSHYPLKILIKKKNGLVKITPKMLCIRYLPTTPSVIFNRMEGIKLGLFDEKRNNCEDIQFFQKFFKIDSYYVLAEDLVEISPSKKFVSEKGLSSNIWKMHKGREANTKELYKQGYISGAFYIFITLFNQIKFIRKIILQKLQK